MPKTDAACARAIAETVRAFESQENLARFCKVSPQTVSEWVRKSKRLPIQHLERLAIEMEVPPAELRPDLAAILKDSEIG